MKTIKSCLAYLGLAISLVVAHAAHAAETCYVDVLFALDAKASAYLQDEKGLTVDQYVASQLAGMNTVLTNSGLHTSFLFRSAGAYELGFEAVRLDTTKYLTRDVLEQATQGEGQWAKLHNERDNRGADIVSVIVDTGDKYGHVGDSNSLQDLDDVAGFAENAYSVVGVRSTFDWHALLHEVGHNFGAGHVGGADQSAPYSHGWYFVDQGGVTNGYTVMAYLKYDASGKPIPEAPVFSSPNVTWKDMVAGDAAAADNVRVIQATCQGVSQWRKAADEPPEEAVGPFMTTGWNQRSPYNDFAAVCGSQKAPCGCAATAAVQLFKYYAWPARLGCAMEGAAHKYVDSTAYPFDLRFDGHNEFKWGKMNDQASDNDVEGNYEAARATLWCDAIGAMDFRPGDSSAEFKDMADRVTSWFEKGQSYSYNYHGEGALWSALVASLDRKEPVQVMLTGHQVVADGYAIEEGVKKVHINWGANDGQTRWYGWTELQNIGIIEVWAGFRPKKTVQIRPLPKKMAAGIVTFSWDVPKVYAESDELTGFSYTRYVTTATKGDYTGEAGTIATDCADNYYQPGVFGITAGSAFAYTMTSYYVRGLKVELQARFDAGEWETIDTPTLSDKEDSKDASGEVVYTKSVDLGGWSGKEAEFRFKVSRTQMSSTSSARISFAAPKMKSVYMPIGDSYEIPGGKGVRALNLINTSNAGRVVAVRIKPLMTGGVMSEPVSVKMAASGETVPAQPSVVSVEGVTDGFRRTCGIGKSEFVVNVNETTAGVTASSSHLALVGDEDITCTKIDATTWSVAIDGTDVPEQSQLILTLCAEDALGNKAYKDLQLAFKEDGGGSEANEMYHNTLSAEDEDVKVARGTYGTIEVPAVGYYATAFDELTTLAKTTDNTYADIIVKNGADNDTRQHTFLGWFRVNDLSTERILWFAYANNTIDSNDNGYKVCVTAEGKIKIVKTSKDAQDNGTAIYSANAVMTTNTWAHIAVAFQWGGGGQGNRWLKPTLFVNGAQQELSSSTATIGSNLNGDTGAIVQIGEGVAAAGICVDRRALDDAATVVSFATNACYVTKGREVMPEPVLPLPILIDTGYDTSTTNGGVEVTVVMEIANVAPTNLQALLTLNVGNRTNAVGVAVDEVFRLSGIAQGAYPWGSWKNFAVYPAEGQVHRIAFGYAGTSSGVNGSGGYRGTKIVIDGTNVYDSVKLVYGNEVVKRIALGGGFDTPVRPLEGAEIKSYTVYPAALGETEMKELTQAPIPVVTVPESISVNVIGGNAKGRTGKWITSGVAGVCEIGYENWNQLAERSDNNAFSLTTNLVKEVRSDGSVTETELGVTLSGKCAYTCGQNGVTPNGALLYGYIDDGNYNSTGRGAGITVTDIPYCEYTLYVYFGSDGDKGGFGPICVNGMWYPVEGEAWGDRSSARSADPVLTEGQNCLAITGLTAEDLEIVGSINGNPAGTRCGIAGFQLVNTGARRDVMPDKGFTYEPKADAKPTGWLTGFGGEQFIVGGQFRIAPGGECVSAVSDKQHPWANLASKTNYTMALYADLSQVARDMTGGRYLMMVGKKGSVSHGLVLESDGNVALASGTVMGPSTATVKTATPPAGGYHLFVWTQSETDGATLYVDGVKVGVDDSLTGATGGGFQLGSLHSGVWANYAQAYGLAVAGVYGWDCVLTDAQVAQLAEQYPATEGGVTVTSVDTKITGTLTLVDGDVIPSGTYGCSIAVAGATLSVTHAGEVSHGTAVLTATSLTIAEGVKLLVNDAEERYAIDGCSVVVMQAVAEVAGRKYGTIAEAVAAAGNGGTIKLLVEKTAEIDAAFAALGVTATQVEGDTYKVTFNMATGAALVFSEIMPKPSDKPYEITTQSGYDKNGLESGWVEVVNTGDTWADLGDYRFMRSNRGKKYNQADYGNFPTNVLVAPHGRYTFYTSERYANSASQPDSAFEHGTFDGKPIFYGDMLIWGDKVNPKKFPMVTLAYLPAGAEKAVVVDTVVVPSDTPEGWSIIVGARDEDRCTQRWLCPSPTFNAPNGDTTGLVRLGPNVGPLYGVKHSEEEFKPTPPATPGEAYSVALNVNAVYNGTTNDAIVKVVLKYRTKLDKGAAGTVEMTPTDTNKTAGVTYSAEIPAGAIPSEPGQLIQWRTEITDAAGNVWTSPSFNNPDDGYEWYGTITEPGDLNAENLATWHMFADEASIKQMDTDADKQTLPNKARVAIYDSSTSNYYDYVRIDLRGNTSKNFTKKSHGLRFSKVNPMTMFDPVRGTTWEEIRKTSLIGEPADPSRLRQLTSFWLWNEMGNNVPFDFPVRCNLNGAFFQVGFNSERFTDELIEDVYGLDKYGYGYKNVGTLAPGSGTTAGGIEKKTPDDGNESDVSVLQNELRLRISAAAKVNEDNAALTKVVVERFDLPAWLNYLAAARITQEMDDVWANISAYYDAPQMLEGVRGTATWMPLGYDFNLSLGQWYYGDATGVGRPTIMSNQDWFKSHPFYGGMKVRCYRQAAKTEIVNNGNYGIESVLQSSKFRRLFLRRLRTLMDAYLGAPDAGETFETTTNPIIVKMKEVAALMGRDGDLDRTKYPWDTSIYANDVWGEDHFPANITAGIEDIYENYIVPRREHLYVTHSVTNAQKAVGYGADFNAGIPEAQSPIENLKGGFSAAFDEAAGVVVISNMNAEAVDLSGWKLEGPVAMTLPAGTVVDSNDVVYVVTDRRAYVAANEPILTDQVIVGNAMVGKDPMSAIILKTADGVPVIAPSEKSEQQQYLRLWGFCGCPATGNDGAGEFIILTNLNAGAVLDIEGAYLNICKFTEDYETDSSCKITFPSGWTIGPGGYLRIGLADGLAGWSKIQNGDLKIRFLDKGGAAIYELAEVLSQEAKGVKNKDKFLRAVAYEGTADDWEAHDNTEAPGGDEPEPPTPESGEITGEITTPTTYAGAAYTVSNATIGAALTFTNPLGVTLTLADSSTASAKITATGTLTLAGEGRLALTGETELMEVGGFKMNAGTLDLTATRKKKIRTVVMHGDYYQNGGTVNLNVTGQADDKNALGFSWEDETNATFTAKLEGSAVFNATMASPKKSAAFRSENSAVVVTFAGDAKVTGGFTGASGHVVDTDADIEIKGGAKVSVESTATGGSVFEAVNITIKKSTVDVSATGAGTEIFSAADTIRIDNDKAVLTLVSDDDCFSAQTNITVLAKKIEATSLSNDAFDSNGSITVSGGTILAYTQAVEADGVGSTGFDTNGGAFNVNGGTVVSLGGPNSHPPAGTGSQAVWTKTGLLGAACSGAVVDVAGTSVTLPVITAETVSLQFSAPNLDRFPEIPGAEVTPVVPGDEGTTYATEEAATNAAEKAVVLPPNDEVTNVIDAVSYAGLFKVRAVPAEGGWKLVPELKESVSNEVQTAVDAAVDAQLVETLADVPTATVTTQAGLYYGMAAAASLDDIGTVAIPFARWVLGDGKQRELTADRPSEVKGFYRIRVQITPPKATP